MCSSTRYALHLFWSPLETSGGAKAHLRVFLLLRSISFVLSTLQLRSGYPPPASYRYNLSMPCSLWMLRPSFC